MHNQHHQKILALAVPRGCGAVPAAALRTGGPVVLRDDVGIGHILPAGSSLAQHMHDALIDALITTDQAERLRTLVEGGS